MKKETEDVYYEVRVGTALAVANLLMLLVNTVMLLMALFIVR